MYAIISDGGRQFKVEEGQELDLDLKDVNDGDEIKLENVLAISGDSGLQLGTPTLAGAAVTAQVMGVRQGDKLVVRKFRRRKNSKTKTGHRQMYTRVKVSKIEG